MSVYLAPTFGCGYQGFTNGGLPLNAGLIYTYIAGGTTPQATYTTSSGNVQNANPIVLDASGRTPSEVWLDTGVAYRFDVKDSAGNLLKTYDNLYGIGDPKAANAQITGTTSSTFTFNGSGGTSGSVTMKWQKAGNFVTLNIPAVTATTGTGSTVFSSNSTLPASIIPAVNQYAPISIMTNNAADLATPGLVLIGTNGQITIKRDGAATAWTNSSSCGTSVPGTVTFYIG